MTTAMFDRERSERFLRACRLQPVDRTPVWLMRQAGRYWPGYRALRERYSMLELLRTPELALEITLQPVHAFELDAAIVFSDILLLLDAVGMGLEFVQGEGPRLRHPVRDPDVIERWPDPDVRHTMAPTLDTIRAARRALEGWCPLIGFTGAPYTLALYAVEGRGSPDFQFAREWMAQHPEGTQRLLQRLAQWVGEYMRAQWEAGAQAIQIFDTWAAGLSVDQYFEWAGRWTRWAMDLADVHGRGPFIVFAGRSGHLLECLAKLQPDVVSVGSDIPLDIAWSRLGYGVAVQGNLDPSWLLRPPEELDAAVCDVLRRAGGRPGHIFNLGHGVPKETDPEQIRRLVTRVHTGFSVA